MPEDPLLSERFSLLPRATDDSDWDEVLLRAEIHPDAKLARRLPKLALLAIGVLFVVGLIAAGLIGASLHHAQAAPPGPTHVQRQVRNGTVRWLFAHEPRGQSPAKAHIALLSTVGAHWQPVRFARAITPDPRSQVRVVLSLIGKRGRNICMTVYLGQSSGVGGGCAVGLLLKPFNYDIFSHMSPSCSSCSDVVVAGVASDDVARMELFLPGTHRPVPLRANVFVVTLSPSVSAWSLVAYDRSGLVIGRSSPPPAIQIPAPSQTPANPPGGLTLTQVTSEPNGRGPLSPAHENVEVQPDAQFAVGLRNGNFGRKLKVTVTISGGNLGQSILRRKTITLDPHAGATVRVGNLVGKIRFAQREQLKVEVTDTSTARPGCAPTRSSSRSADTEPTPDVGVVATSGRRNCR
jgi:hypothetical protein